MTEYTRKYKISTGVAFQPMKNEAIIVNLNSEEIHKLNTTGKELVRLLEKATSVPEILTKLSKLFTVEKMELADEVNQLLGQLLDAGLIYEIPDQEN